MGEGEIEDARPPRFANILGAFVLSAATVAYALGWDPLGAALAGIVALLRPPQQSQGSVSAVRSTACLPV